MSSTTSRASAAATTSCAPARSSSSSTRRTPAPATRPGPPPALRAAQGLAERPTRHLVLLTATPHSGDEEAFFSLLGLLDPTSRSSTRPATRRAHASCASGSRATSSSAAAPTSPSGRSGDLFPDRETTELTYKLTGAWEQLLRRRARLLRRESVERGRGRGAARAAAELLGRRSRSCAASPRARPPPCRRCARAPAAARTTPTPRLKLGSDRVFDGAADALPGRRRRAAAPQTEDASALPALIAPGRGARRPGRRPEARSCSRSTSPSC